MKTVDDLKSYLLKRFPNSKVYLFGSYAKGKETPFSDIDIAIEGDDLRDAMIEARFKIEESCLPFKVDLVDLSQADYLKEVIKKEGILWH